MTRAWRTLFLAAVLYAAFLSIVIVRIYPALEEMVS